MLKVTVAGPKQVSEKRTIYCKLTRMLMYCYKKEWCGEIVNTPQLWRRGHTSAGLRTTCQCPGCSVLLAAFWHLVPNAVLAVICEQQH